MQNKFEVIRNGVKILEDVGPVIIARLASSGIVSIFRINDEDELSDGISFLVVNNKDIDFLYYGEHSDIVNFGPVIPDGNRFVGYWRSKDKAENINSPDLLEIIQEPSQDLEELWCYRTY